MIITGDSKAIAGAYIAARSEINNRIPKTEKGVYGNFATLNTVLSTITDVLASHKIVVLQEPLTTETGIAIATSLLHESGATIEFGALTMPLADRKPQAVGSAVTYARRYALVSIFGLMAVDDDGQAAQDTFNAKPVAQSTVTIVPVAPVDNPFTDVDFTKEPLSAHQRMWNSGLRCFGDDWDAARPWLLKKWTKHVTPDNVRTSAGALNDEEKGLLAAYINEQCSALKKVWPRQKAMMLQSTN